jgi:multimeric flavodoxin WrbA
MTKVLAFNGSPKLEKSNTALILSPFLEGMTDAGAEVELFYTRQLNINPCTGEFHCWNTTPGECYIDDDMQTLYPKLREADLLVLATPVYIPLPGEMQNLINRLCPLVEPILEFKEGRTRAKLHADVNIRSITLFTTSGWWELGNMDTVVRIAEELAKDMNVEFAGAVRRPHASLMRRNGEKVNQVKHALKHAGRELTQQGRISENLLKAISQPLISEEEHRRRLNSNYLKVKNKERS